MKNKAVTYFLIAAVVCVWGWVIFKLINTGDSNNTTTIFSDTNGKAETSNAQLDTFSLIADYRDPFVIKYINVNTAADINLEEIKEEKIKHQIKILHW